MEEGAAFHNAAEIGNNMNIQGSSVGRKMEEVNQRAQYSMPGILHFLETEWAKFQMERAEWEVERAELQARIAFLQGERKGQENLKQDLVRRIKMLEYALKQERTKMQKMKMANSVSSPPITSEFKDEEERPSSEITQSTNSASWRQGRHLLRQYLQEIGYAETIINVRSARVRQMLDLDRPVNGSRGKMLTEKALYEAEASVLATMDFLQSNHDDAVFNPDASDEEEEVSDRIKSRKENDSEASVLQQFEEMLETAETDDTNKDDWEVDEPYLKRLQEEFKKDQRGKKPSTRPTRNSLNNMLKNLEGHTEEENNSNESNKAVTGAELVLGELKDLTVSNICEEESHVSSVVEPNRKTWQAKYMLRSHFDAIRSLAFFSNDDVLVTGGEDHTLKLWNVQRNLRTSPGKKAVAAMDIEPVYTFRGHRSPVIKVALSENGEYVYSSSLDGEIRIWKTPLISIDPYELYDNSTNAHVINTHTDAVWGLAARDDFFISASSDSTIGIWKDDATLQRTINFPTEGGTPTCVDILKANSNQVLVSCSEPNPTAAIIYDIETGESVTRLDISDTKAGRVNSVAAHPSSSLVITAHDDRQLRFFDAQSGKLIHSMTAHLDSITSVGIDPSGLYCVSGSHDCSLRIWSIETRQCIQEITAHRKKFDEAILDVAFHPNKPLIASAGADALAKVFI